MFRILILAVALGATSVAFAQAYPTKAVRIVNPFAPGGATDIIARHMGQKLTEAWGQPVVVENRAGASGALGVEHVAKSPADGYTLLIATQTTHAANPALYAKLPYDAAKDFAPLTLAGSTRLALMVHPSLPAADMRRALAQPDTKERLTAIGVDIVASTPQELGAFNRAELVKWAKIVKDSGAKLD